MRRAEIITAAILAIFSVLLMIKSAEVPIGWNSATGGPAAGTFPFWLSGGMLLSSIWIFVRGLRGVTPQSRSSEPYMDPLTLKLFALTAGSLFLMILAIHFVGMYVSIPLFFIFYMRFMGRHSWITTAIITISVPIFLFLFFEIALKITLPKGITEPLFYPLYALFY
jgi:putative tricarboxylic transport membrane protein